MRKVLRGTSALGRPCHISPSTTLTQFRALSANLPSQSNKKLVPLHFSPKTQAAVAALMQQACGQRSDREILPEVAGTRGNQSYYAAQKASMERLLSQTSGSNQPLLPGATFHEGDAALISSEFDLNNEVSQLLVTEISDALFASPDLKDMKTVLRHVIAAGVPMVAEFYIAALLSLAHIHSFTSEVSTTTDVDHPATQFGFHLIANACSKNEDTQQVWEAFFGFMTLQRQPSMRVDSWLDRYEQRMMEKVSRRADMTRVDGSGKPIDGQPEVALPTERDLDALLFPEFEELKKAASQLSAAASQRSTSPIGSADREPLPPILEDSTLALPISIAKLCIQCQVLNHNLPSALSIHHKVLRAQPFLKQKLGEKLFFHNEAGIAASLLHTNASSSQPDNANYVTSTSDQNEILAVLCYANRFSNRESDGGFKRSALRALTGRADGELAANVSGSDSSTKTLLQMPWSTMVQLFPALTLESSLTLAQLKAAFDESKRVGSEIGKRPGQQSTIPLFVWESIIRQMCALHRVEEAELLFRQLLPLHVGEAKMAANDLSVATATLTKVILTFNKSEGGVQAREALQASANKAAAQFKIFEAVVSAQITTVSLLANYLHSLYLHKRSSSDDQDLSSVIGFLLPHQLNSLEEICEAAIEAHTNYLTAVVHLEQTFATLSSTASPSPSSVPPLDLNLAHNQLSEMVTSSYEARKDKELMAAYTRLLDMADTDNARTMIFFELADRGFIRFADANKKGKPQSAATESDTAALQRVFSRLFKSAAVTSRLSQKLPETFDFEHLDSTLFVPSESDAELVAEEAAAVRKEFEEAAEAKDEDERLERNEKEADRSRKLSTYLSDRMSDARREVTGSRRRQGGSGSAYQGSYKPRHSQYRPSLETSQSPRWSERHRVTKPAGSSGLAREH